MQRTFLSKIQSGSVKEDASLQEFGSWSIIILDRNLADHWQCHWAKICSARHQSSVEAKFSISSPNCMISCRDRQDFIGDNRYFWNLSWKICTRDRKQATFSLIPLRKFQWRHAIVKFGKDCLYVLKKSLRTRYLFEKYSTLLFN